ncbi:MAG: hypothetical protein U5J98_08880 [Halobacteriales archaeon]|nr:hypothetical protein [Halobacteriales archaeon]
MQLEQLVEEGIARRYDYDDRTVFAADFGAGVAPAVDVVDDTVIVVTDDGRQRELELPAGEARAFNRNGVVTVEVRP